ncbi:hypothetical protein ACFVZH_20555 [Streptomyces sp. NPDC059534]|uniref:hypothetical protein n=1 Tax=Streptomyces sp. NPDC059534 TaxID=3346859 RepID=UPI0036CF3658
MTGFQAFTTGTAALRDLDPYRFPAALVDDVPESESESASTECGLTGPGDRPLPLPEPVGRRSAPLRATDRRRLELHAALTTAGVAPLPGDLDAIEALCELDRTTHTALLRWITHQ